MVEGFFSRAGSRCTDLGKQAGKLADDLRALSVAAQAATVQTVAERLDRLGFDAKHDAVDFERVANDAHDCAKALRQVAAGLAGIDGATSGAAERMAQELEKLGRDAISATQPIDPQ